MDACIADLRLADALKCHQQHDFEKAEALYQELRKQHPDDSEVPHAYAILLGQCQRYEEGIALAKTALALHPSEQHHNTLANLYKKTKQFDLALAEYKAALVCNDRYAVAMNNMGALYLQMHDFKEAMHWLQRGLAINPDYMDAQFNLGLVHVHMKQPEKAIACLRQVVMKNASHAEAWMQLGLLYMEQGDDAKALDCIQSRLQLEPDHLDALFQEGVLYHRLNELEKATKSFERCVVLQPDHMDAHHNVASIYMDLRQSVRALPHYLYLAQRNADPSILFNIAVVYMHREQHKDAVTYFKESLKLDPSYLQSHINLASLYLKMQDHDQAKFHYQAAKKLDPENDSYDFILSAIAQKDMPDQPPSGYVKDLFDSYADSYDKHLTTYLKYQLHELVYDRLMTLDGDAAHYANVLDIGCGTGLCGESMASLCDRLVGIDISEKMLAVAGTKNIYKELHQASYEVFLAESAPPYDLIVAADVMPYIGDPEALIRLCASHMKKGAYLMFSIEKAAHHPYALQTSMRYAHHPDSIRECLERHGLAVLSQENVIARHQNNKPVVSVLWVATPCAEIF